MSSKRQLPTQLRKLPSSRKGKKLTPAELQAKKPRVELNLKQKCAIIDEAKRRGFKPDSVERTLSRVNQTQLAKEFEVTKKTINRILWKAKDLKEKFLDSPADLKRSRPTKYGMIEERVVAFLTLLRNRPKPLPVSFSIIKAKAEEVAESLGETNFKASSGWWEKVRKRNGIGKSIHLHGEAGEVDHEQIKKKIDEIRKELECYDLENIYNWDETGLYFKLIPHSTYTARNEARRRVRGTKAQKAKDRVTLITCTNATGNHKIPLAMIGKAAKPRCFRVNPSPIPYNNQANAWNDSKLTKWWFHDVFLPEIRKRTSRQVVLLADNFGSHDIDDIALQDPQVKWILLPPNCTAVHQPMDQGVIAALKASYKTKLLHVMIRNLDNYDQLRQLGAALTAGVRGLDHAYPPNLLDAASLVYQAWDSLTQATLANCWLKADILPLLHTTQLRQHSGRYHQQCTSSAIQDLCTLLKSTTLQSLDDTADFEHANCHLLGDLRSLCVQSTEDPDGLGAALEEWFTIEDNELVRMDEIEMALEEEQCHSEEFQSTCIVQSDSPAADTETPSDDEGIDGKLIQPNRKNILNQTDLDESLKMVKSLLHLTSSLQEDGTTNMLTKVYRKCLELKKEKVALNSRQTVIRDFFHNTEQPMDL